ncbi:MAG: aminotransferase class I/II-fold pyridoxal phosphate-dependent enzyme [Candidatus Cybelea sp.]
MSVTLDTFALERYFARYEFSTRYLLCSSDAQAMPVRDLLALEPDSMQRLADLSLGYTESRGSPALRQSIASLYEHRDPESVLVHAGSDEALFAFANVVLARGDQFIVQFPCYQSHYSIAQAIGAELLRWHSDLTREGSPGVEELERLVTPATRAIVLTTPNNPTGYAFGKKEIERVVEIARKNGLWLFSDEVYRGLEREAERIPAICDLYERGVSLGGLSKAYGLAGLRIGWIATPDPTLYGKMAAFKDYLSICNSAPSEFLAQLALANHEHLLERVRRIVARNLGCLDGFFARRTDLFEWTRPRAGTTAFVRYLRGSSEAFCARAVEEAGVLLLPSTIYDAGDEHLRFGYGRTNLPEALAAFERFLDSAASP